MALGVPQHKRMILEFLRNLHHNHSYLGRVERLALYFPVHNPTIPCQGQCYVDVWPLCCCLLSEVNSLANKYYILLRPWKSLFGEMVSGFNVLRRVLLIHFLHLFWNILFLERLQLIFLFFQILEASWHHVDWDLLLVVGGKHGGCLRLVYLRVFGINLF